MRFNVSGDSDLGGGGVAIGAFRCHCDSWGGEGEEIIVKTSPSAFSYVALLLTCFIRLWFYNFM